MRFGISFGVAVAASLAMGVGNSSVMFSQQMKSPTLDEMLQRLEANLDHYDSGIPSFFCDEHVMSTQVSPGMRDENTVTDSIFRLKRSPNADRTTTLVESREIRAIDGKPAKKQQMDVPTMLEGAFEGGLAVVSAAQTACMKYDLLPDKKRRADDPYVIRFSTELTPQNTDDCLLQEKSKGRVLIDPASMQIRRLELVTPHHVIIPGNGYESAVVGERVITVDYKPVLLGNENFWMPTTITLRSVSGEGTFHRTVWSFEATYRNYHKLDVKYSIVPGSEVVVP